MCEMYATMINELTGHAGITKSRLRLCKEAAVKLDQEIMRKILVHLIRTLECI